MSTRFLSLAMAAIVLLPTSAVAAPSTQPSSRSVSVASATRNARPTTPVLGDPLRFFVTQFRSEWNPNEALGRNGNCGPACVVMAAIAFNRVKAQPQLASRQVRTARIKGTGQWRPGDGTSVEHLAKGARHYGLDATAETKSSIAALTAHVQAGGLAICCVAPRLIDPSYHSLGHYVLVTAIDKAGVHINDPGRGLIYGGIRVVPLAKFAQAWQTNDREAAFIARPDKQPQTVT
ncbi:MAG: C39 family peptidase [Candidatus Sericytochromatia bacterium]|nr:C39 family peptidase [Candidatus Sericytochromatia bacterium]